MSEFTSPAIQAMNLIRYVGDEVAKSGAAIHHLPEDLHTIIHAPSFEFAFQIVEELEEQAILKVGQKIKPLSGGPYMKVNLTLEGWKQYEAEKRGQFEGNYGFVAMQFGDPNLDPLVNDIVKPTVEKEIGYNLIDMRDVARAGIIDNIMRTQIRDAAFVIADLTHDNSGAYWEAGYAEGLGKPVIYICEKDKFDGQKTHFDTNHCTMIPWSRGDEDAFCQELIATLRRSLDL